MILLETLEIGDNLAQLLGSLVGLGVFVTFMWFFFK